MNEITVRAAEPEDAPAVHWIASAPGVRHGTLQMPYQTLVSSRKKLEAEPEGLYRFVAEWNRTVIGFSGLHVAQSPRRRHVGEIGMMVHDDWQGKGVGSHLLEAMLDLADNWLNLHRIELQVYPDNHAAIHLYERHGFVIEGTMRDFVFRDGKYIDACVMGRVRSLP